MVKYKPCCDIRCLLGGCEIRDNGGCYCACRLDGHIANLKRCIDGKVFHKGSVYIADHESYWNGLSEDKKKEELEYREYCKAELIVAEKQFKDRFVDGMV